VTGDLVVMLLTAGVIVVFLELLKARPP